MNQFTLTDSTKVEIKAHGEIREDTWGAYRDALTSPNWRTKFENDLRTRGYTMCHGDYVRLSWEALDVGFVP